VSSSVLSGFRVVCAKVEAAGGPINGMQAVAVRALDSRAKPGDHPAAFAISVWKDR
jgi:hypothetical protein